VKRTCLTFRMGGWVRYSLRAALPVHSSTRQWRQVWPEGLTAVLHGRGRSRLAGIICEAERVASQFAKASELVGAGRRRER
jgi:hypothetical protein